MAVEQLIQIFVPIILYKVYAHLLLMIAFVANLQELGRSNLSS